jgi:uncharacterized protein YodC (DUF2158 family)
MEEKVYFVAGDVVRLRQQVPNAPIMVVRTVDKMAPAGQKPMLLGVTCFWFTTTGEYQEKRFNTKDLVGNEQ